MKALPLLIVVTTLASSAFTEDWPHWRGPTRDGISGEIGLPSEWSTTKNVSWRIPMPDRTGATPIIWGETVFLNVAGGGELHLWALDRKDGSVKWKKFLSGGDHRERKQNMSSPSPVTDGKPARARGSRTASRRSNSSTS
jgi:outer membrane protein assembly factor BamB